MMILQLLPYCYLAFFIKNSRSFSVLLSDTSSCPVLFTHLDISSSDSGSSDSTLSTSPEASRSISIFVRNTGSGQKSPLTSILLVGDSLLVLAVLILKNTVKLLQRNIKCLGAIAQSYIIVQFVLKNIGYIYIYIHIYIRQITKN